MDTASAAGLAPSRAADDPHRHAVKLRAPAKLNLHLGVYPGRDGRGYHHTDSVMVAEYKDLVNRLNRIEGQIRGIKKMVERSAYCPDILIQVAAANAALNSFNKELLSNHIKTCVKDDIRQGKDETVDELVKVLQRLMK